MAKSVIESSLRRNVFGLFNSMNIIMFVRRTNFMAFDYRLYTRSIFFCCALLLLVRRGCQILQFGLRWFTLIEKMFYYFIIVDRWQPSFSLRRTDTCRSPEVFGVGSALSCRQMPINRFWCAHFTLFNRNRKTFAIFACLNRNERERPIQQYFISGNSGPKMDSNK